MTNTINGTRLALVLALAVGALAATFGLGSHGPPPVSAQADNTAPTILKVSFSSTVGVFDGVYTAHDIFGIEVVFSETVRVIGAPQLELNIGGDARTAEFEFIESCPVSAGGDADCTAVNSPGPGDPVGNVMTLFYRVRDGDLDRDGVSINANSLSLNGGTINDTAQNAAVLTHDAVSADSRFIVDTVPPTVSSIAITSDPGDDDTYATGDRIEVTVTFSEDVKVFSSEGPPIRIPHLELDIGGESARADYQSHQGADVVFAYTVQAGDTDENGIAIGASKLRLNGGLIRDDVGDSYFAANPADLSHDAVPDDSGHMVQADIGGL